jgi:hypothetical protein
MRFRDLTLDALKLGAITLASLSLLAVPAPGEERLASCGELGAAAADLMELRQANVPMSVLMGAVEGRTDPASRFIVAAIRDAYDVPRFFSEERRRDAVLDFRIETERLCYAVREGVLDVPTP